jgi:glutamate-1-semialdehyde 2,1-aminomutase
MTPPARPSAFASLDPRSFEVRASDVALFDRELRAFVPPQAFDAHAHWYDLGLMDRRAYPDAAVVAMPDYLAVQRAWMGDLAPRRGLFFPMPTAALPTRDANLVLTEQLQMTPDSRGLAIVRPEEDPSEIERLILEHDLRGFKVYHLFAERRDTQQAGCDEYMSRWMWELAEQHGLILMLHLVRDRALADAGNLAYLQKHAREFPNARIVLAHAGRGFCGRHTVEGLPHLRGLANVYFDTSVICEPLALEAILEAFGPRRLLYGSDFPLSQLRGKAITAGDGFHWVYEHDVPAEQRQAAGLTLVGLESLLAVRDACRRQHLRDADVERIFRGNVEQLLGLGPDAEAPGQNGQALYRHAQEVIPVGVQLLSKRPQLHAPGQWPPYAVESRGCEVTDVDGRTFVDLTTNGIGSCLLGFADPDVSAAVQRRVAQGSMSTLNDPEEVALADRLVAMHPWAERARFARTGGEALSVAVRIARAATGRDVVAVCGYHGWSDWYLAANLTPGETLGEHLLPGLQSHGVPRGLAGTTQTFRYNHPDELEAIVKQHGHDLAAVVMEPTRSVPPDAGFFARVSELCGRCGAKLVFDEVTTGFRLRSGGAHLDYGVRPDLAVFAKALGNGHPIAAVIGTDATMQHAQRSFISSTYWTEGVGLAAALATLDKLEDVDVPRHVETIGRRFRDGLQQSADRHGVPLRLTGYPALTYLGFDHPQTMALTTLLTVRMLRAGYLAGGAFYPTLAHQPDHVDGFLAAADPVMAELAEGIARGDVEARIGGPVRQLPFARLA